MHDDRIARRAIDAYRRSRLHALWHARGYPCRFIPSCSDYAIRAVRKHGLLVGSVVALARLLRCNPWYEGTTVDFPPMPDVPATATRELTGCRLVRPRDTGHWRLYVTPDCGEYVDLPKERVVDGWELPGGEVVVRVERSTRLAVVSRTEVRT